MTKLLIVNSAATGDASVSSRLTGEFASRLAARVPGLAVTVRDVGRTPVPHLVPETVGALRGGTSEAEAATQALSDELIREVQAADIVVIGAPMYNFGIPSTLKTWFDHVLRGGVTFRYTATGPEGLIADKPVVVIETRGGLYSEGPAAALDAQEPHLRAMLGFVGLTDVRFIRAEGLATAGAESAIERAVAEVAQVAEGEFRLAA